MADDTTAPAGAAPAPDAAAADAAAQARPAADAAPKSVTVRAAHFVSGASARPTLVKQD